MERGRKGLASYAVSNHAEQVEMAALSRGELQVEYDDDLGKVSTATRGQEAIRILFGHKVERMMAKTNDFTHRV